ncbi:hypothetical protein ACOTB3_16210 [Achromobacter xylosoxidans]
MSILSGAQICSPPHPAHPFIDAEVYPAKGSKTLTQESLADPLSPQLDSAVIEREQPPAISPETIKKLQAASLLKPDVVDGLLKVQKGPSVMQTIQIEIQIHEQLDRGRDSLRLYLQKGLTERKQQLAMNYQTLEKLRASGVAPDVVAALEEVLKGANTDQIVEGNQILGQYAQFMSDLSALMVRINSLVGEQDGKPKLHEQDMLDAMQEFQSKYSGDKGVIKSFTSEAEAKAFQDNFRGGTVKTVREWVDGRYVYSVRFNTLSAVTPILHALCDTKENADIVISVVSRGTPINDKYVYDHLRKQVTNSAVVQGLSLATSDVQKTFQTDLDLQISGLSRSIAQFDNLAKLYSALVSSLTDTYKSYLG